MFLFVLLIFTTFHHIFPFSPFYLLKFKTFSLFYSSPPLSHIPIFLSPFSSFAPVSPFHMSPNLFFSPSPFFLFPLNKLFSFYFSSFTPFSVYRLFLLPLFTFICFPFFIAFPSYFFLFSTFVLFISLTPSPFPLVCQLILWKYPVNFQCLEMTDTYTKSNDVEYINIQINSFVCRPANLYAIFLTGSLVRDS